KPNKKREEFSVCHPVACVQVTLAEAEVSHDFCQVSAHWMSTVGRTVVLYRYGNPSDQGRRDRDVRKHRRICDRSSQFAHLRSQHRSLQHHARRLHERADSAERLVSNPRTACWEILTVGGSQTAHIGMDSLHCGRGRASDQAGYSTETRHSDHECRTFDRSVTIRSTVV